MLSNCSSRPKSEDAVNTNVDDVLRGLVEWICAQVCRQLSLGLAFYIFVDLLGYTCAL